MANVIHLEVSNDGVSGWTFKSALTLPTVPFTAGSHTFTTSGLEGGKYYRLKVKNYFGTVIYSEVFQKAEDEESEFKVVTDTQACDEEGGSDVHFFLNVLAGTTSVYMEYNPLGEGWQRNPESFPVVEGENDIFFPLNSTPPMNIDILVRFVDVDNEENVSEVYEWVLLNCETTETILDINSYSQMSCNTQTGVLTVEFSVMIANIEGGVRLVYDNGGGWTFLTWITDESTVGIYSDRVTVDISALQGQGDIPFALVNLDDTLYSSTILVNVIACVIEDSEVELERAFDGNLNGTYTEVYQFDFDSNLQIHYVVAEVSDNGESGWSNAVVWQHEIASNPITSQFQINVMMGGDNKFYRIKFKNQAGDTLYSNVKRNRYASYLTIISFENGFLSFNYSQIFDSEGQYNVVMLEEYSNNSWGSILIHDIGSGAPTTGGAIVNITGIEGTLYRLHAWDYDGNDIYSTEVVYNPSSILIDHADSGGAFFFSTINIYEYNEGGLDLALEMYDGGSWVYVSNTGCLVSNPSTTGYMAGFLGFTPGHDYRLVGKNILGTNIHSNEITYLPVSAELLDVISGVGAVYTAENVFKYGENQWGIIILLERSEDGATNWNAVAQINIPEEPYNGENITWNSGQWDGADEGKYFRVAYKNQFGDILYSNVLQYSASTAVINTITKNVGGDIEVSSTFTNAYSYDDNGLAFHAALQKWDMENEEWFLQQIEVTLFNLPYTGDISIYSAIAPQFVAGGVYRLFIKNQHGYARYSLAVALHVIEITSITAETTYINFEWLFAYDVNNTILLQEEVTPGGWNTVAFIPMGGVQGEPQTGTVEVPFVPTPNKGYRLVGKDAYSQNIYSDTVVYTE